MASEEAVMAVNELVMEHREVLMDLYTVMTMYDRYEGGTPFITSAHLDLTIRSSAPSASALAPGEVQLGDGTGPNGRDELFWSVDGSTVARVEADSVIT